MFLRPVNEGVLFPGVPSGVNELVLGSSSLKAAAGVDPRDIAYHCEPEKTLSIPIELRRKKVQCTVFRRKEREKVTSWDRLKLYSD